MPAPLFLLLALAQGAQQPAPPAHDVPRVPPDAERPTLDGRVDEPFWAAIPPISELRQVVPVAGAEPTERTEIRLAVDEDSLWIALVCFDRDPSGVRATQMERDANLDPDDRVELLFDTFLDRRNAFWFQIGAAGSQGDALVSRNGSSFNKRWDAIWWGRAQVTERGWEAELRIPAQSINFDPKGDAWGFNARRFIRRRNEEARWAWPDPAYRFFWVSNAGTLRGTGGMRQGLGLDLKPFGLTRFTNDRAVDDADLEGDLGLDLFYRVTSNVKLSASFNTDFAETEVDERRVNLTRFPLFFPEQRDFFLEDSGVFEFGTGSRDAIPFFSRRIGIGSEGQVVPLLAAAKLTGTTDSYGFGVLDVVTDETDGTGQQNLFVGRFSKNVLAQSDVGVIATAGDPEGGSGSSTVGVDFNFRTDEFLGDRNLRFSTWVQKTDNEGVEGEDLAYAAQLSYPNDEVQASIGATVIEEGYRPALGFAPRTGIRRFGAAFTYRPRLYSEVRRLNFGVEPTLITGTDGAKQTERLELTPFGLELETGDEVRFDVLPTTEMLDEDFEIVDGVVVPVGEYDFTRYGVLLESADFRPFSAVASWFGGGFFDGDRYDYALDLSWRVNRYAQLGSELSHRDVVLEGGAFDVNVTRFRLELSANPNLSWTSVLQWDDQTDVLGVNSRVRWILEPGRELYFVVNHGWDTEAGGLAPIATDVTLKLGYTIRI